MVSEANADTDTGFVVNKLVGQCIASLGQFGNPGDIGQKYRPVYQTRRISEDT